MPKTIDTPINDERDKDEKKKKEKTEKTEKKKKIAFGNLSSSI